MNDVIAVLAEHAARTLPDSICERKRVLRALEKVLTEKHPALKQVRAQLAAIKAVDRLNEELPLHFGGGQ